jgi:hypothetical protein
MLRLRSMPKDASTASRAKGTVELCARLSFFFLGYSDEIAKLKKELKKAKTTFGEADRARLFGTSADEISVCCLPQVPSDTSLGGQLGPPDSPAA